MPTLSVLMSTGVSAADRPNVVFLLSDDQGWNDYGFMGHRHLQTPNIDRLAQAGLIYQRGHVTAPMCRPSLASLVTGMYPHQTEIRGNDPVLPPNVSKRAAKDKQVSLKCRNRMTAPMLQHASFVTELKKHGYATLQTGKCQRPTGGTRVSFGWP